MGEICLLQALREQWPTRGMEMSRGPVDRVCGDSRRIVADPDGLVQQERGEIKRTGRDDDMSVVDLNYSNRGVMYITCNEY